MNFEKVNDRISQLPIAMAGIVHAFSVSGRGLSIFEHTERSRSRSHLLACTDGA